MGKIIGIDLGTTNSVVCVMEGGEPVVIPNQEGARTTPSVVAFAESGEVLVGQIAKRQAVTNPEATVFSAKRFMGRRAEAVAEETRRVPYRVVAADNGDAAFELRGRRYAPPEISAKVLHQAQAKQRSSTWVKTVSDAVITVPAYFNDSAASGHQGRRQDRRPRRASVSSTSRRRPRWPTASTRRSR
jgi:molecular chaperone DnaK